jgi:hypothetical protein
MKEVPYRFLMVDGLKKAEQKPFRSLFGKIPIFDLTKERLEKIDPADQETIQQLVQQTPQGFEQLLEALDQNNDPKARTYIRNLYEHTMTFLDYWLQRSEWLPLNINAIESAFSRIANRIKPWANAGATEGFSSGSCLPSPKYFVPSLGISSSNST